MQVWKKHPSYLADLPYYLLLVPLAILLQLAAHFAFLALGISVAGWQIGALSAIAVVGTGGSRFLWRVSQVYILTPQALRKKSGFWVRSTDYLELYRIQDVETLEPLWLRVFGLGNVRIISSDATTPQLVLEAVKAPANLAEDLLEKVRLARQKLNIRVVEDSSI